MNIRWCYAWTRVQQLNTVLHSLQITIGGMGGSMSTPTRRHGFVNICDEFISLPKKMHCHTYCSSPSEQQGAGSRSIIRTSLPELTHFPIWSQLSFWKIQTTSSQKFSEIMIQGCFQKTGSSFAHKWELPCLSEDVCRIGI